MRNATFIKEDRIEIRASHEVKSTIQRAADSVGATVTSFVTQQAFEAAKRILAERELVILNNRERDQFLALLESPPKVNKPLKALFKKYS